MAHQDSFDPKPLRPDRISRRDGHRSKTKLDGVFFNEYLKQTAQVADKITVCRSMTHGEAAHERGTHNMFTGYRPSPAIDFPSMGSVVSHEFGAAQQPAALRLRAEPADHLRRQRLPVSAPTRRSASAADPANGNFTVQDLTLPGGVDDKRFDTPQEHARRGQRALRREGEGRRPGGDGHLLSAGLQPDQLARRPARRSTSTPKPAKLRDEYGRNAAGQRMLLARRLVGGGRALRVADLRRLGHARRHQGGHGRPAAAVRPGVRRADPRPGSQRPAQSRRW